MEKIEKKYFSIGEVADHLNVSASLIRFWETQFDEIKPRKNKNGVRQYTKQDIAALEVIYHLVKEKGFTLHGAKEAIKEKPKLQDTVEVVQSLEKIRDFLADLQSKLKPDPSEVPSSNGAQEKTEATSSAKEAE